MMVRRLPDGVQPSAPPSLSTFAFNKRASEAPGSFNTVTSFWSGDFQNREGRRIT